MIAIGYTMVYGIIGMINFAHGEVYMIGSYVAFMVMAGLMMMGIDSTVLLLGSLPGQHHHHRQLWLVHRTGGLSSTAGRQPPYPLISAIGMSIFLQNMMRMAQGSRDIAMPTLISGAGPSAARMASRPASPTCSSSSSW